MSALAARQFDLIRQFDDELSYWVDGLAAVMHVGGVGGRLDSLRRGREANRPPAVTLEPRRNGQLMLGMVVSRPRNGRLIYDTVLGHWDLSVPFRRGGPLNEDKPRHRRVAAWGLQLLRAMIDHGRKLRNGTADDCAVMAMPRLLIPFTTGEEKIDASKYRNLPDALVDTQMIHGKTMIDSRIVPDAVVSYAIDHDQALEDFRTVTGQCAPNPFRNLQGVRLETNQLVPLSQIYNGAAPEVLAAARRCVGRGIESGATDADIISAAANPTQDLYLSLFSKVQVLPTEHLADLSDPYVGSLLPPVDWRAHKKAAVATA